MTMSIRHFNAAIAVLFAAFAFHAVPVFASDSLDPNGKLQIESGRIGESSRGQQDVETAQEKIVPDLFKKKTAETVKAKQQAEVKTEKQLKKRCLQKKPARNKRLRPKLPRSFFQKNTKPTRRIGRKRKTCGKAGMQEFSPAHFLVLSV